VVKKACTVLVLSRWHWGLADYVGDISELAGLWEGTTFIPHRMCGTVSYHVFDGCLLFYQVMGTSLMYLPQA
jgi:hypothetical protein